MKMKVICSCVVAALVGTSSAPAEAARVTSRLPAIPSMAAINDAVSVAQPSTVELAGHHGCYPRGYYRPYSHHYGPRVHSYYRGYPGYGPPVRHHHHHGHPYYGGPGYRSGFGLYIGF